MGYFQRMSALYVSVVSDVVRTTVAYNSNISLSANFYASKGAGVVTSCNWKREVDDSEEQLAFVLRVGE
jgi:anthranilate/para-aminobenzoate synthase component I